MAGISTDKSLERQLKALQVGLEQFKESTQRRIARGGVSKALRVLAKGIKGKVPPQFKDIKKVIGVRMAKSVGVNPSGKTGAGVGVKAKKRKEQKQKRDKKREGRPGVGIGAENVHWFVLGTQDRKTKKGVSTGRMPPQVPDIVKDGVTSSWSAAQQKMIDHIRAEIPKEAAKLAAKVAAARSK